MFSVLPIKQLHAETLARTEITEILSPLFHGVQSKHHREKFALFSSGISNHFKGCPSDCPVVLSPCELLQPGIGSVWADGARDTSAVIPARKALRSAMKRNYIPSLYFQRVQNTVWDGHVWAGSTWSKTDTHGTSKLMCLWIGSISSTGSVPGIISLHLD